MTDRAVVRLGRLTSRAGSRYRRRARRQGGARGSRLLSVEAIEAMRSPTVELVGDSAHEAVGLSWFLRTINGTVTAAHPGTTNGQHAELCLVAEKPFAVWMGSNGMPLGMRLNREAVDGILDEYFGRRRVRPGAAHLPARSATAT